MGLMLLAGLAATSALAAAPTLAAQPQHQTALAASPVDPATPHRQRLILKDGSFQIVMSYRVAGQRVVYLSAERGGEEEAVPLALVDLNATRAWETSHGPGSRERGGQQAPPVLSPELQKEETERAQLSPEVASDLRLQPQDEVLALDVFHGGPELVPLLQSSTDLSEHTQHSILKGLINPHSATHQMVLLKGEKADVQMHVPDPVFYLRTDDVQADSGPALTVDTHGAAGNSDRKPHSSSSEYVIVRADVREGARVIASFNTSALGSTRQDESLVETVTSVLPGGHWMKIAPRQPMLFGEYALVEVLGANQINLGVWDFGVHPTAPENRDVTLPEQRRPEGLGHHPE
jgi:hypothetical protein